MNTIDGSQSSVPAGSSSRPHQEAETDPLFSRVDLSGTKAGKNSPGLLRRLLGHWWQILVLWLVLSVPVMYAIKLIVEPTFEAYSLLRMEPTKTDIFAPLAEQKADTKTIDSFLQTQVKLLTSDRVLNAAIADSAVINLAVIKKWDDPKTKLREDLSVQIMQDAYLIRVALELPDADQAATIVNSVVNHYLEYNTDYNRARNSTLSKDLKDQLEKLKTEINTKRRDLDDSYVKGTVDPSKVALNREIYEKESDPRHPAVRTVTLEQLKRLVDSLIQSDLEYVDAVAKLEAVKISWARNGNEIDAELEARIAEAFQADVEVAALKDRIKAATGNVETAKKESRAKNEPSVVSAQQKLQELTQQYDKLRNAKHAEIRRRLSDKDNGMFSKAYILELETAVETAKRKKLARADYYEKMQVEHKAYSDKFEVAFLDAQIKSLMKRQEQLEANLAQLDFDARQDTFRVGTVDPATAPKTATSNKHIKLMLIAPVAIFFLLLSFFMVREIQAGRHARSNRVEPARG
jgi:uncharacterized protein involved in exopolysaccharide biosynthesis